MTAFLDEIRKKDKNAAKVLYNLYGRKLYGFALSKWHVTEDEGWDLVYKTLYKIIEVIDRYKFENENKFNGFVYRIFINNLRNHYNERKNKKVEFVKLEDIHGSNKDEKENEGPESPYMKCLKKILEQFEDWKRVLLLMKAQDFSYDEIASYVEKPAGQLKVYYMRAKQVLIEKVNECVNTI